MPSFLPRLGPPRVLPPYGSAVRRSAPLNAGLQDWFMAAPGQNAGQWRNLARPTSATAPSSSGAWSPRSRPGGYGAMTFDRTFNQGLQAPIGANFVSSVLITLWVWAEAWTNDTGAILFGVPRTGFQPRLSLGSQSSTHGIEVNFSGLNYGLAFITALPVQTWVHLGIYVDQSSMRLYRSGILDNSRTDLSAGFSFAAGSDGLYCLGGYGGGAINACNASLDDIAVRYDVPHARALDIMRASMRGYPDELVAPSTRVFVAATAAAAGGPFPHFTRRRLTGGLPVGAF